MFLPDLKPLDTDIAARYFNAPDYPEAAARAILAMAAIAARRAHPRGVPPLIVRHLVLPRHLDSTRGVLRWFAGHLGGAAMLSLMFQYTPVHGRDGPQRRIRETEYRTALEWLAEFGIENGYCQERPLLPGGAGRLPAFERANPFPPELAAPVWNWRSGTSAL
jgi:putative pyruvate formate lyase activating enzyme